MKKEVNGFQSYLTKIFVWMFFGLFITFSTAFLIENNINSLIQIASIPYLSLIMLFVQIGVVLLLVSKINKMKTTTTKWLFILYSALTGVTFSFLVAAFTTASIALALGMTVIYFGALSFIGAATKIDLTKVGNICVISLFVLIIVELFLLLFNVNYNGMLLSAISLIIFSGLTAYDMQKIKKLYETNKYDKEKLNNLAIYGAFDLYLDFINIFVDILNFVGDSQ